MVVRKKEKPLWEVFSELTNKIRQDHIEKGAIGKGHNFLHALMTGQYAEIIAEEKQIATLSWIAGVIHNTDRIYPKQEATQVLQSYLSLPSLNLIEREKQDILQALTNHSKLNDPNDNPITVTLKDADRLANIGPNIFIRSAQLYHQLFDYDPRYVIEPDPTATYRNPKTCLHDIRCSLEWEPWLRLPKAKEIAKPWFDQLRTFIEGFAKQLEEVGLMPYPFPQDFAGLNE